MLLEILGFLLSSLLTAVYAAYKITGDIHPFAFKRFLYRVALKNWQKGLEQTVNLNNVVDPQSTQDTGVVVTEQEIQVESPKKLQNNDEADDLLFYGIDDSGNGLMVKISRTYGGQSEGRIFLHYQGQQYKTTLRGEERNALEFSVGNLKLEMVEAMRIWRVWYNGVLQTNDGTLAHVTMNMLWKPIDNPRDLQREANADLLSQHMASVGNFGQSFIDLPKALPVGYGQFGAFHGTLKVDGTENVEPFYLYGFRLRRSLKITPSTFSVKKGPESQNQSLEIFVMCGGDGNAFRLSSQDDLWTDGLTAHVCCKLYPITNVDALPREFSNNHSLPKLLTVQDKNKSHRLELWSTLTCDRQGDLEILLVKCTLNGRDSRGIILRNINTIDQSFLQDLIMKAQQQQQHQQNEIRSSYSSVENSDFVELDSGHDLPVSLVGGKGSSLAALSKLSLSSSSPQNGKIEFRTSPGFCVTSSFFRRTLNTQRFKEIFDGALSDSQVNEACSQVQELILNSGLEDKIGQLIAVWMNRTFVECKNGKFSHMKASRFAVRSSGTLEDGEELSCAGQNETFLGVKEDDVAKKVVECWASLFTPLSVRYRLNHGEDAVTDMGVVVQAMVNAKAAGVIFTADPITGNPFEMLINANYGLGESVVSASCDPDTIRVVRPRKATERSLQIGEKTLGKKESKIVLLVENGSGGPTTSTKVEQLSEEDAKLYCLDDSLALKLGEIAVEIEKANQGKPCDIEWAIEENTNQIYILQSRNITSLDAWTDFELIHEFDTSLRTQFERLTNANTGEVMPGATSPLGLCTMTRVLDVSIQSRFYARYGEIPSPICMRSCAVSQWRFFMNVIQIMYRHNSKEIQPELVAVDLSIFGHKVIDEEFHRLAVERWGVDSPWTKVKSLVNLIKVVRGSKKEVERVSKKYENYQLDISDVSDDPNALLNRITERTIDLVDICKTHCAMSEASSGTQVFAILFLAKGRKAEDWDSELYHDVSTVLSVCQDVESADIPTAIDKLAQMIVDEGEEVIEQVTGKEATSESIMEYLQNRPPVSQALQDFMKRHGHRGIYELDMMRQSWRKDPRPFTQLLQSLVANKSKFKDTWKSQAKSKFANDEALLDSLQTPLTSTIRKLLKFMLPHCRSSVFNREKSKSLLVLVTNELKCAYYRLGELLVQQHVIRDPMMVYFFTHNELRQIIDKSPMSARILYKTLRRQKLHPTLDSYEFDEIMVGIPKPRDTSSAITLGDSIKATPVSCGKIQGIVKVCRNIEEASQLIQPGDILVTHSTDIGWSPFFPIIGGVVTELGGLISHGAVVAREYGLPCIVGATHATKVFQTGDKVVLDATNGLLSKVAE